MGNIDNKLEFKGAIIFSGKRAKSKFGISRQDKIRYETARRYIKEKGLPEKYILSGAGPDLDKYIKEGLKKDMDIHNGIYEKMMEEVRGIFGVDPLSMNTIQNIENCFPEGTNGLYIIPSYPLHLKRIQKYFNALREEGKISKEVRIELIPTKQPLGEVFYEFLGSQRRKLNRKI